MNLSDLAPHPKNPRKISDDQLKRLTRSLEKFGDLSGIVFNLKTKRVVGGHQRIKALPSRAKITIETTHKKPTSTGTVATGFIEIKGERFSYRQVSWDEDTEKAANIAANKHGGEWDMPQLTEWLSELNLSGFEMDLTGFGSDELEKILKIEKVGLCDPDEIPEHVEPKAKRGDIYQLGRHRLMCGDSLDSYSVETLMNRERADICFTSPPYTLGDNAKLRGYNGDGKDSAYWDRTDHKSQSDYLQFLIDFTNNAISHADNLFCNIQLLAGNKRAVPEYWHHYRGQIVDVMVWDKEHAQPAVGARVLNSVWEFIFIITMNGDPKRTIKTGPEFRGTIDNIYRLNPIGKKDPLAKDHGACFPVKFAEHFVEHFAEKSVMDLFGGSGTTLIACEKLGRKCFMMELDPRYCDVIVARWEKFTGHKAVMVQ